MPLKLKKQPTFTRDVQIFSPGDKSGHTAGTVKVEYKILPTEELDELVAQQKSLQLAILAANDGEVDADNNTRSVLRASINAVVNSIEGLEIDGVVYDSDQSVDWFVEWYLYGQQLIDFYWEVTRNVKKHRAKN